MKPLGLDFTSMVLQMKNKEKYFQASEIHQKCKTTLKRLLFEPPTLEPKKQTYIITII